MEEGAVVPLHPPVVTAEEAAVEAVVPLGRLVAVTVVAVTVVGVVAELPLWHPPVAVTAEAEAVVPLWHPPAVVAAMAALTAVTVAELPLLHRLAVEAAGAVVPLHPPVVVTEAEVMAAELPLLRSQMAVTAALVATTEAAVGATAPWVTPPGELPSRSLLLRSGKSRSRKNVPRVRRSVRRSRWGEGPSPFRKSLPQPRRESGLRPSR